MPAKKQRYTYKSKKERRAKAAAENNGEKKPRSKRQATDAEPEQEVFIDPSWRYTDDIDPVFRKSVLEALEEVRLKCKSTAAALEKMELPDGAVLLLDSHRLVLQTVMKQSQDGAPFKLPVKSLRALIVGLNFVWTELEKVQGRQGELGLPQTNDTDAHMSRLAELRRRIAVQRDIFGEDRELATAAPAKESTNGAQTEKEPTGPTS